RAHIHRERALLEQGCFVNWSRTDDQFAFHRLKVAGARRRSSNVDRKSKIINAITLPARVERARLRLLPSGRNRASGNRRQLPAAWIVERAPVLENGRATFP